MKKFTIECLTSTQGTRVRAVLSTPLGLTWKNCFEGPLDADAFTARVSLEPGDVIRVSSPVKVIKLSSSDALARNRELPGNVRFALTEQGESLLVADTRLDGEIHLPASITEIKTGLAEAIDEAKKQRRQSRSVDRDKVQAALDQWACSPDAIVNQEYGWELRPHLPGATVPVRARVEQTALRIERTVLSNVPSGRAGEAMAHQALLLNSRLRHVRLAAADGCIVAEARLHAGLIQHPWIVSTARAVAFASRCCDSVLEILATNTEVCQHYVSVFHIQQE